MTTGERIRARRKKLGISADALAKNIGVSRSTVFRWENGFIEKKPIDKLVQVARILQTSVEYLMGWEENEQMPPQHVNDDEALEILEELHKRPEMKILFDVGRKATKEDILKTVAIVDALRKQSEGDDG